MYFLLQQHHPAYERVEKEDWKHRQQPSLLFDHLFHKHDRRCSNRERKVIRVRNMPSLSQAIISRTRLTSRTPDKAHGHKD